MFCFFRDLKIDLKAQTQNQNIFRWKAKAWQKLNLSKIFFRRTERHLKFQEGKKTCLKMEPKISHSRKDLVMSL